MIAVFGTNAHSDQVRYHSVMGDGSRQPLITASANLEKLCDWYSTPLGQALELAELTVLRDVLANLFGYHLLVVAPPWQGSPIDSSRIPHRLIMPPTWSTQAGLVGHAEQLPFSADSLDLIILPHTIEFTEQPHEVLREVDRCLVPDGQVLILGFNPYGLWGLWRLLYGWRRRHPWTGRFISHARLRDWLALLGFDTLACRPFFYRPPLQSLSSVQQLHFLDHLAGRGWPVPAAGYQLLARKRVAGMTPLRPRWRPRRSLLAGGLIEPSSRSQPRNTP